MENRTCGFRVPLEGWVVECETVEEAMAIQDANAILVGRNLFAYSPADIDRIVAVLKRHGRESAAEALHRKASRMRAALFLKYSAGYESPMKIGRAFG
jgi:hypothetical protein